MKFTDISSLCFFLVVLLQISKADIQCYDIHLKGPFDKLDTVLNAIKQLKRFKAPDVKATGNLFKQCPNGCAGYMCFEGEASSVMHGYGCPEDFYAACSSFERAINEIRSKGSNNLDYYSHDFRVLYSSGCGNKSSGTACIVEKFKAHMKKADAEIEKLLNESSQQNDLKESSNNRKKSHSNDSNSKNGSAIKFIETIIFGWIFVAAWIYLTG